MKTFKDFYQKGLNEAYKDLGINKESLYVFAETLAPKIKSFKKQGVMTCARVDIDDEGKGITLGIAFVPDNTGYSEVANSCAKQFKSFFVNAIESCVDSENSGYLGEFSLNQLGFKINLIGEEGSSNYSEIIIQFILPKDSGVVVSRGVCKELCLFFSKEYHIDVLSKYGESKGFVKSVVTESKNTDLADELRDCLTTIYQVAKNARDEGIEFKGSVLKEINNNINVLISNIEKAK